MSGRDKKFSPNNIKNIVMKKKTPLGRKRPLQLGRVRPLREHIAALDIIRALEAHVLGS